MMEQKTPACHRIVCDDISNIPLGQIPAIVSKWESENPGWGAYVETSLEKPAIHARFIGRSNA